MGFPIPILTKLKQNVEKKENKQRVCFERNMSPKLYLHGLGETQYIELSRFVLAQFVSGYDLVSDHYAF
jgi:hypothetical protein